MNIINIRFELTNPFDRWDYFKPLGCLFGKLSKYKSWEIEHSFYTGMLLDLDARWTRNVDHAGPEITIGILGYGIGLRIYDTRHWDYGRGEWVEHNFDEYFR